MKIDNGYRWDRCPLCVSSEIHHMGKLAYGGKVNFSSVEIELIRTPELWQCQRCGSAFVQNIVDPETAQSLYTKGQADARWPSTSFDSTKTENVVRVVANIFKSGGSVLDIGCNTGELLDFARHLGCETSGVEFSLASREILRRKGHKIYSLPEETRERYDIITAFDVVEHLYDVPAFLSGCINKLAGNGRIVVMTGNIDCLSAKMSGNKWWYAQFPEHIVFPSKKFFLNYSGLGIEVWAPNYAAETFEYPFFMRLRAMLNYVIPGRTFTGLPSLVPDHTLIVLRK